MARYTIIPDVHGCPFWRDAVKDLDEAPAVFLGDYLDPYPQDGVIRDEAWQGLTDKLAFKKRHPDCVTLLLENHGVHYLHGYPFFDIGSRYDYGHAVMILEFFMSNLRRFDMAFFISRKDGNPFLLSYVGGSRSRLGEMHLAARANCRAVCDLLFRFFVAGEDPLVLAALLNGSLHTEDRDESRVFEEDVFYFWKCWMALLKKKGEPDLPDWVAAQWRCIRPFVCDIKLEDLSSVITGWQM